MPGPEIYRESGDCKPVPESVTLTVLPGAAVFGKIDVRTGAETAPTPGWNAPISSATAPIARCRLRAAARLAGGRTPGRSPWSVCCLFMCHLVFVLDAMFESAALLDHFACLFPAPCRVRLAPATARCICV